MKHDEPETLTPDQARARAAVRRLAVPEAEPTFRARLKEEFVSGRIDARRAPVPARPRVARPWMGWVFAPVAAAAALLLVFVALDQPPRWRVAEVTGEGGATVDGIAVPLAPASALEGRLKPGARVRLSGDAALTLVTAGRMLLELTPGTEMTLPASPGRWTRRAVDAEVAGGEVHLSTGRAFHGARVTIVTAEARVEVTGTTIAVLCLPVGTCVCVYEGTARVGARNGEMVPVPAGRRREIFNDGTPPLDDAMLVHEHGNLERLAERRAALLR